MVDYIDTHFSKLVSVHLDKFKVTSTNPYKVNFRCPICGDSKKSRSKARGWLLEKENSGELFFYCHNCGSSRTFTNFLKGIDISVYNDYVTQKFYGGVTKKDEKKEQSKENYKTNARKKIKDPLKNIKKVSQLSINHPIKKYIEKRKVPSNQHYRLYYAKQFKTWINTILPNKFDNVGQDEPRLVIPFFDKEGKMFGVSARGFNPKGVRYITIMFDQRAKIFGLDTVNFEKTYFVVEGAIDSLFLSNSVAMAGADGTTKGLERLDNAIFVFDAEPRNKEIHKRMERIINIGCRICIWPSYVNGKDINEMIMNGMENVEDMIRENTYKDLQAKLKLTEWRKT